MSLPDDPLFVLYSAWKDADAVLSALSLANSINLSRSAQYEHDIAYFNARQDVERAWIVYSEARADKYRNAVGAAN